MTTKRKFPSVQVPLVGANGVMDTDWYSLTVNEAHVGTPATAAAAGTASALPATPAGYLTVTVNGVPHLMPYYPVPP